MNPLARIGVAFYMLLTAFIGCLLLLLAAGVVQPEGVLRLMASAVQDERWPRLAGAWAGGLLLLNYFFWAALLRSNRREKTIVFNNPQGKVSVSVSALEDLVRRTALSLPEIRDVRVGLKASGRALRVFIRAVLNADVNIPGLTSKVQEAVKGKIQDMIGINEDIIVEVDVVKIQSRVKSKTKGTDDGEQVVPAPAVPFEGYRP